MARGTVGCANDRGVARRWKASNSSGGTVKVRVKEAKHGEHEHDESAWNRRVRTFTPGGEAGSRAVALHGGALVGAVADYDINR